MSSEGEDFSRRPQVGTGPLWITAIREFKNSLKSPIELYRVRTRELVKVGANASVSCNVWIPWCDTQRQFDAGEHIVLRTPAVWAKTYFIWAQPFIWIWQQGDYVRYSRDGKFHFNGERVPGDSRVDGDRALELSADGTTPTISLRA
jgi:hypothetical protein